MYPVGARSRAVPNRLGHGRSAPAVVRDGDPQRAVGVVHVHPDPVGPGVLRPRSSASRSPRSTPPTRPAPPAGPAAPRCTSAGSGSRSASALTASPSPRSASTGGWMPRTRSRSSVSASAEDCAGLRQQLPRLAGSFSISASIVPRFMPMATSRACAPSCRSRSMRRSSAAEVSTASCRVSVSRSMRSPEFPAVRRQRRAGEHEVQPQQGRLADGRRGRGHARARRRPARCPGR